VNAETYLDIEALPSGASLGVVKGYNKALRRWEVHKTCLVPVRDALVRSEPRLLSNLKHDHIVPIYNAEIIPDYDELVRGEGDVVTFSMPFIDGGSLRELVEGGSTLSVGETIRIGVQVGSALAYLHTEQRMLHRDVKPGNILVRGDRSGAFLTDFGSAALLDDVDRTGPYGFELYYGDGRAVESGYFTPTTDTFGLATALFEACSGPLPFEDTSPAVVHDRVYVQGRRPLVDRCYEAFAPHIPAALRRVLRKGMRREPGDREPSARDFVTALDALHGVDWRPVVTTNDAIACWEGFWSSTRLLDAGRRLKVETRPLKAGRRKGDQRVEALYLSEATGWRRMSSSTITADDVEALADFFDTVDDAVAHNRAAS
jgi:serine/threonine protein kinase